MLRSRDVIRREPVSFSCMSHVPVSVIIPVLNKWHSFLTHPRICVSLWQGSYCIHGATSNLLEILSIKIIQYSILCVRVVVVTLYDFYCSFIKVFFSPVGWGYRIHRLLLCRLGKTLPHNGCPEYDTKQSHGEVPVMLELCGMWSTPSLPSLPGPLWSGVVAPDRVLSMGQIELKCVFMLNWIAWNRTVLYAKLNSKK